MNNLDNIDFIKKLDRSNTLGSIKHLADQCQQAWTETNKIDFPPDYQSITNIVVSGMGGSTYGVRIIKSLYQKNVIKIPIELANNYWLPGYVNENTLVFLSSYSGTTDETISAAKQAKEKGAKIIGITTNGILADFLKANNYASYIFEPKFNPSQQPRIGVGYMVMGLLGILSKLKLIPLQNDEVNKSISYIQSQNKLLADDITLNNNRAKTLALKMVNKIPVLIVADFLEGAAYAVRNPFHETAKQFALYFSIPELNHHLLEGLTYPDVLKKLLIFIMIKSNIYDLRNSKRLVLTSEVINKNGIPLVDIILEGDSALTQTFELISLFSWVTFYLAILNNIDPAKIPWVDYFKEKLKILGG